MVSWVQIADRGEISKSRLHSLAADYRCVRVGATQNPKDRISDYRGRDADMFMSAGITYASMFFSFYRGSYAGYMKEMEQQLIDTAKANGRGRLNVQQRSGYPYKYTSGFLYVILAEHDIEQGLPSVAPSTPSYTSTPSYPERPPPDCFMTTRQKLVAFAMFVVICIVGFFVLFVLL